MRIEHNSVEDFCDEIRQDEGRCIFDDTVRVRIDREPMQKECVTFRVCFRATAIVSLGADGGEYLAELALAAGVDDEEGQFGSRRAAEWKDQIERVCAERGLKVRPGRIEV